MAWGTIRKATAEDEATLQAIMDRFGARHNLVAENLLVLQDDGMMGGGSYLLTNDGRSVLPEDALTLRRYLRRNIRRAGLGDGLAYGYVGYHAD